MFVWRLKTERSGYGHIGRRLLLVHDAAKPWDRRSPERLGINAQVDDPFHASPSKLLKRNLLRRKRLCPN